MTFVYSPTIPQATDKPSDSQPLLLANFRYLNSFGNVDHNLSQNSSTPTDGMHKQITFAANEAAPGFGSGVSVLYPNITAGQSQLFYTNAAGSYQVTGVPPVVATNGYTWLPGGLILQWGVFTPASMSNPVLFATVGIAFPNNCFSLVFSVESPISQAVIPEYQTGTLSRTGFTYNGTFIAGINIHYIAIGN